MNLYFEEAIDIHHIFPKAWCEKQLIKPSVYNSIVNKTPLTARTNRVIGGRAPSDYLERLANSAKANGDTIKEHVSTHLAVADLTAADDFEGFLATRARALLDQIALATCKAIEDLGLTNAGDNEGLEVADDTEDF